MIRKQAPLRLGTQGISLIEMLFSVLLVSVLFYVGFRVVQQSREEMQKAFWLQESIIRLRNATRALGDYLKKTSYPSTIIRQGGNEDVVSYKELRRYDGSGRLRHLEVKDDKNFDLHLSVGSIALPATPKQIMVFPICIPEKEEGALVEGKITWIELLFEPETSSGQATRGRLRLLRRDDSYNTSGLASRAFSLQKQFNPTQPPSHDQILVSDVVSLEVSMFESEELRGIAVSESGNVEKKMKKRYLVSCRIDCVHPRDEKWRMSDQVTVANNIDLTLIEGGVDLIVLAVHQSGSDSFANIRYKGSDREVRIGDLLGDGLLVQSVFPSGIQVKSADGKRSMTVYCSH